MITESVSARTDTQAETAEAVERENGTEIEAPRDAMQEETMMTDHQEEIGTFLTIEEAVVEADAETEAIATADLEEVLDESDKRAQLLHPRRRNRRQISQISSQSWSVSED